MTRRLGGAAGLLLALGLGGCDGRRPAAPRAESPAEAVGVSEALDLCVEGEPAAALDAALDEAPRDPDALVARGLCRWAVWGRTDDDDDARAAYQDLTEAVQAVDAGQPAGTPLDQILSHRAFVARGLDGGWVRTLEDLDRAVGLDPDDPTHVLDRAVVRSRAGDAPGARADLGRFLALTDTTDDERRALARGLLDGLGPPAAAGGPAEAGGPGAPAHQP